MLRPGTYHINYGRGNEITARSTSGGYTDKSFHPFLYVEKGNGDQIATRIAENLNALYKTETATMKTFWQGITLELVKIYTHSPIQVKKIAEELEAHINPNGKQIPQRANVFASDINYLLNYLIHQEHGMYEEIKTLQGVCIDIELLHKGGGVPEPGKGEIVVGGTRKIEADFEKYTIEPTDEYQAYTGDDLDIARKLYQDCFRSQFIVGHNLSFDIGHIHARVPDSDNYIMNRKNFSNFMRGAELSYPKTCFFDTIYAAEVAIPRIASHQLEMLCLNLGLETETSREYIAGGDIPKIWKTDPDRIIKYNQDDINSTIKLANYIFPNIAAPCVYAGLPMENMFLSGPKALWETLAMKRCAQNGILIPHYLSTAEKREGTHVNPYKEAGKYTIKGAETKHPEPGPYENIISVDIGACYPTIICRENISPETVIPSLKETKYRIEWANPGTRPQYVEIDPKPGIIPEILKPVMEMATDLKKRLKTNKNLKGRYAGLKSTRNAAFGFTGVRGGHSRFTNNYAAALITELAREQVQEIAKRLEAIGAKIIYIDTDGLVFQTDRPISDTEIRRLLKDMPFEIDIERYTKALYLAHKNYILVDENGNTTVKGSTLVQRSYPQIIRWALKEIIDEYMVNGKKAAKETRMKWITRIQKEDKESHIFTLTYSVREEGAYSEALGEEHSLRKLSRRIRETRRKKIDQSETVQLYVARGRTTSGHMIKPIEKWEPFETFSWEKLDRTWYSWFLDEYLLKEILGLDLGTEGRTKTILKGEVYRSIDSYR